AQKTRRGEPRVTSALNPRYTFENFVVGAANRLAATAGRTVAENPGSAYNPLFVYSGPGLGKTHLLMGVGHTAKQLTPGLNIEYLTLDARLISRLSGGLVVDIGAPDYETRVAILRRKAEERGASFGPGVLEAVADAPLTNVRELMGAVNRLMAHQAGNDSPIDGEAAKRLLGIGAAAPPP